MRLFLLLVPFLIAACNKPDPNPENRDEIYQELNKQIAEITHAIDAEEKQLVEHKKNLSEVVPQTGQIKFAQKRVFDSQAKIDKMKQQKNWLEIRTKERLKETRKGYLKAFKANEPWPDPKEFEEYKAQTKLRQAKRDWDVKERIKDSEPSKPKGEGGEKKSEEKKEH